MNKEIYQNEVKKLLQKHEALILRRNEKCENKNGIYERFKYPILSAEHTPVFWRYDLDYNSNPDLLQRFGINAAFNSGAILFNKRFLMVVRVEGWDRKSFFAMAESPNGIDQWRFWDYPLNLPDIDKEETNVYDMRLTLHEDGWVYGIFCSERKDPHAVAGRRRHWHVLV